MISSHPALGEDLKSDTRWQLVERIALSSIFQKATRLRLLLLHLTERTLHGHTEELTEQQIGRDVFLKPESYTTLEDSSVRVYVRQLRLKLHEYFDSEGRAEALIVEVPKGSYIPVFRKSLSLAQESAEENQAASQAQADKPATRSTLLPWITSGVLACICLVLSAVLASGSSVRPVPWPISSLLDGVHQTHVVVADINYDLLRVRNGRHSSLGDYLQPDTGQDIALATPDDSQARLLSYIRGSTLTSFADVVVATVFSDLATAHHQSILVQPARDLRLRDLENGNYVFVGSPSSNPWVSLFQAKLNFIEIENPLGNQDSYFSNLKPRPGEQNSYKGLPFSKSAGEDYADLALLPCPNGSDSVMVLQGLHQEGTEAAGRFLGEEHNYAALKKALGVSSGSPPQYFEVLLKTEVIAGTPNATSIVAARSIIP